jgi:hypothetical protein
LKIKQTFASSAVSEMNLPVFPSRGLSSAFWRAAMVLLVSALGARAQVNRTFEPRYRDAYLVARTNWLAAPTNLLRSWEFSRASFDVAEFATNDTERAALARTGIEAAETALRIDDTCAPAHYYLAMNYGQLARTQTLGALRLVSQMEKQFKTVAKLDPGFDYAGADRNLGILYREAPGWPASIGSRAKARTHLEKSVKLRPDYPGNQLELLHSYLDWKEHRKARSLLEGVEKCLGSGKERFAGDAWEWSWDEWNRAWTALQARLAELAK